MDKSFDLPPLPDTEYGLAFWDEGGIHGASGDGFTADQMQAYALAAVEAEREACADLVENADTPDCGGWTANGIADAIRARGKS